MGKNFVLLLGAQIFLSFGGLAIPPLLPFLQGELKLTYTEVGSIMTFHYVGAIVMSSPAGWITDRLGVKKAIVFSLFFTGFFVALLSLIGNYLAAILLTLIVGLGYGMSNPPTTKGIMMLFQGRNLGLAMSAKQTGVPIAGGIAAGILPPLAVLFSWQFSFIVAGVLIGVAGLLSQILMRQDLEDLRPSPLKARKPSPSDWKKIYRNKNIILLSIAGSLCALVQTILFTYTILYLKDTQKFELIEAAFCLTLMNIGGIIGRVVWGVMSDRLFKGSRKIVLLLLVSVIFLISLTLGLDIRLPRFTLILILFVLGASAIGWNGVYHAFIGEISGKEMSGRATGLVMTVVFLGSVVGPIIFGKIIDVSGSYNLAWLFLTAAMIGAFAVYTMIREENIG
jgi:MFS transporter, ACS family, hexuronate transporter